jgi:pullulanase-type alpha-1,6-glucosidase
MPLRSKLAMLALIAASHVVPAVAAAAPPEGHARLHYHRPRGDYDGWGLHAWEDARATRTWASPLAPTGRDEFGVYWDVPLKPAAKKLGVIVHHGDRKDPGPDLFMDLGTSPEAWLVSGRAELHAAPPEVSGLAYGDLGRWRAHWIDRSTLVWPGAPAGATFTLLASPAGTLRLGRDGVTGGESLPLAVVPAGLTAEQRARFPHLASGTALRLDADRDRIAALLRGQLAVGLVASDGSRDATGIQIPGVLDDLFASDVPLGATWERGAPTLRLWAPTATRVRLHLFDGPRGGASRVVEATATRGVWSVAGAPDWAWRYYLWEVTVFTPVAGRVETSLVTDPYSRSLSANSERSQIVNLADPSLAPAGWDALVKPPLAAPEDAVVYELHVRDFSAADPSVPDSLRGTYLAFTLDSHGTRHLRALAEAGVTHVHLLPSFDLATVDENRGAWERPAGLEGHAPDSEAPQAAIQSVRGRDGFNWGYDPVHYGVPEGSYSPRPDGTARLIEFRRMVQALSGLGLRVVVDVVYNHTHASGLARFSVLDRVVPGYYHRLNADGAVENSTCCANTASEHTMMEHLMVSDLVHWARDHKVDGFRFDLMGHHMRANLERAREALDALTPAVDGADGRSLLLYGEGWDFGEVQGGRRGVNATQKNLAGTGIGTFNDRLRDAVRGGNPFSDRRQQGFATGLFTTPGELDRGGEGDRQKLLDLQDRIKVGLAGNLRDVTVTDRRGQPATGASLGGTGYAADPQECVNYVEAHDNETLWDKLAYAAPVSLSAMDRARMQVLALSVPALAQGIPFFHAGGEILRSKSMDADSYDSGDWFNRVDWTLATNHWGMGLPMADKNRDRWAVIGDRLRRANLAAGRAEIAHAFGAFRDLLAVRRSSPLFRLREAADVKARVGFLTAGPAQTPGVIAMALSDAVDGAPDLDAAWERVVVVWNATPDEQRVGHPAFARIDFELHPVQREGRDPVARGARVDRASAQAVVPARTVAVFVAR